MDTKFKTRDAWLAIVFTIIIFVGYGFNVDPTSVSENAWYDLILKLIPNIIVVLLVFTFVHFYYFKRTSDLFSFHDIGMEKVLTEFNPEKQGELLSNAKEIKVLKTWFPDHDKIKTGILDAIKNKAEAKLLLCKPNSNILKIRSEGSGNIKNHGHDEIISFIKSVSQINQTNGLNLQIRFYDEWPGAPLIWIDKNLYMGFYFRNMSSPFWPWIKVRKDSKMDKILNEQFNELWLKANSSTGDSALDSEISIWNKP